MKVVINTCLGGFGLSNKAIKKYLELKQIPYWVYEFDYKSRDYKRTNVRNALKDDGQDNYTFCIRDLGKRVDKIPNGVGVYSFKLSENRSDEILIKIVEELGKDSFGLFSDLKVINLPDNVEYDIEEDRGVEKIIIK